MALGGMLEAAVVVATFVSTLLGGLFALRFSDRLHLILGFSAGAIIAVAFFDLLPESIGLAGDGQAVSTMTALAALGFMIYMTIDRAVASHAHAEHDPQQHMQRGRVGAASLCAHSLFDGIAIGLSFQVSRPTGVVVAIAVLVHDFSDGINTVNLILKNIKNRREAFRWLLVNAAAPALGVALTSLIAVPKSVLASSLALFSGFFLYIGASDLVPESYHAHPTKLTTLITVLGGVVLYAAIQLAPEIP